MTEQELSEIELIGCTIEESARQFEEEILAGVWDHAIHDRLNPPPSILGDDDWTEEDEERSLQDFKDYLNSDMFNDLAKDVFGDLENE